MTWNCDFQVPVTLLVSDTMSCNGTINFTDLSSNGPTSCWDFGDELHPTQNPSHTYQSGGVYSVSLTTNQIGSNSFTINNYVNVMNQNLNLVGDSHADHLLCCYNLIQMLII